MVKAERIVVWSVFFFLYFLFLFPFLHFEMMSRHSINCSNFLNYHSFSFPLHLLRDKILSLHKKQPMNILLQSLDFLDCTCHYFDRNCFSYLIILILLRMLR